MRVLTVAASISLGAFVILCASGQNVSGLEGTILIGPTRAGPIKADTPPNMPLADTTFVAKSDAGDTASFTTDNEGRFRVLLKPGHYTISKKGEKPAIGNFGPFTADVVTGKMTKVEWECDSGVR